MFFFLDDTLDLQPRGEELDEEYEDVVLSLLCLRFLLCQCRPYA